jgi:hypothetical protein
MAALMDHAVYPEIVEILKREFAKVVASAKVFEAFWSVGDYKPSEAKKCLQYGTAPPWIKITHDWNVIGVWDAGVTNFDASKDRVYLNELLIYQFKTLRLMAGALEISPSDYEKNIRKAEFLIAETVVHELVHWGDNQVDLKKGARVWDPKLKAKVFYDAGQIFETQAYGQPVQELFDGSLKGWLGYEKPHGWYDPAGLVDRKSLYLDPSSFYSS